MSMEMVLAEAVIDSGDTAWVLISAGLVLFMVPGLAFFYAGLVRGSSALVMLQQNLVPLGLVSITWVVFGYSFAFSGDWGSGFLGDLKLFGLQDIHTAAAPGFHLIEGAVAVPTLAFVVYQMMFAIITPALITGATANRLKPLGWAVLLVLWSIIVYPRLRTGSSIPKAGWRSAELRTGPAELSSTHPPAPPPWQSCWWSANVRDGPTPRQSRTRCLWR
ncbi:hypothetical protein GCM10020255_043730 [Rhodococcus baikonurensis]